MLNNRGVLTIYYLSVLILTLSFQGDVKKAQSLSTANYTFTLHNIIAFHPNQIQSKMMKWNDTLNDYYILDCSLQNISDTTFDSGKEMMSAFFILEDKSEITYTFRGSTILASYNTQNKQEYAQKEYDKIWGKSFPAQTTARAHVFGIEVPEGKKLIGMGFHQKKPIKRTLLLLD
jgi:hypothetical protein